MEAANEKPRHGPKRRHVRKALWLSLIVVLAVFGGRWVWRQVQFTRLRAPLIKAVQAGNTARVRDLLEQGADANVRVDYKPEPLTWASLWRVLRGKAAVSSIQDTVLIDASHNDRPDIVRLLLAHGAKVNERDKSPRYFEWTALHDAAYTGSVECMKILIAHGADIHARDTAGRTPLFNAIDGDEWRSGKTTGEDWSCVWLLLHHGAEVDARSVDDDTPLMHATAGELDYSSLCLLLKWHADVNAQNEDGETTLMSAACMGAAKTVRTLLAAGAEVNHQDKEGKTALYSVLEGLRPGRFQVPTPGEHLEYLTVIKMLLEKGADVRLVDASGKTVLQYAEMLHEPEATDLLRKAAARASEAGKGVGR